jgi:SSS family solute:Na+ symporter/sodium/proline symporter
MYQMGALGLISALSWGLGYFGQPHIIVRFMALRSHKDASTARNIGMSWMAVSIVGSLATGLFGLAWVRRRGETLGDPETIFIFLSQILFHPLVSGFLLAAILAAIMSTISSQLLVSSSSLTEDFYRKLIRSNASERELVMVGRISVALVAVVAIWLATDRSSTILSLVSNAWAGFGAAFGPVILLGLYWSRMTRSGALAGLLSGAMTVLIWIYAPFEIAGATLSEHLYEIVPGFVVATAFAVGISLLARRPGDALVEQHNEVLRVVNA